MVSLFNKVAVALCLLSLVSHSCLGMGLIKPPAIKSGSKIGFISPASPPYYIYNASEYQPHVQEMMSTLGLSVEFGEHAFEEFGYLAGPDPDRAADVMSMFTDPSISGIIANRGGWGCNRIIDMLDYEAIAANPKVIMGYSDLTGLLNAIHTQTGMITFHGPMGIDDWSTLDGLNYQYIQDVIMDGKNLTYLNPPEYSNTTMTITGGKATGRLIGGNLSVFTAAIGSAFLPTNYTDTILFLEDVGEAPYRIDRMLTQLHLAGVFGQISGFVFGICTDCEAPPPASQSLNLTQVLFEKIQPYNIPAFSGAMFGHELDAQFVLPIGARVTIDADAGTIQMLEAAVIN